MNNMTITIEDIRGLSFGATMVSDEQLEEYQEDGILEDTPFELTDSVVCGPLLEDSKEIKCIDHSTKIELTQAVSDIPAFTTNKEIDESGMFSSEQGAYVKKTLKWAANNYYRAWRAGQSRGENKLLEVEERGDGSMYASIGFEGTFNPENLFFLLADTLPYKEAVISIIGYINPDGSISEGNWEYDDYSYWNPTVHCEGEQIC